MSRINGLSGKPLCCPQCQCTLVMRTKRSALVRLFSKQKHYICRACHTEFREDQTVLVAREKMANAVL